DKQPVKHKCSLKVIVVAELDLNKAIKNASVYLANNLNEVDERKFFAEDTTDANGEVTFDDLEWEGRKKKKIYVFAEKEGSSFVIPSGHTKISLKNNQQAEAIVQIW